MDPNEYLHMYSEEECHWWYAGMRAIVCALLPPESMARQARILDAGCGTGYSMGWMRRQYEARVTGIDYYPQGLGFCRQRGERELVQADAAELPFSDEVFDLVTSFDVLSHLNSEDARSRALCEFLRVLRPGGKLIARVAAHEWLRSSHDTVIMTHHRYDRSELRDAVRGAGFQLLRLTFANAFLFPFAVMWRLAKRSGLAPAGSDVRPATRGGSWVNRALLSVLETEAAVLRNNRIRFPFGLSLIAVAGKPVQQDEASGRAFAAGSAAAL